MLHFTGNTNAGDAKIEEIVFPLKYLILKSVGFLNQKGLGMKRSSFINLKPENTDCETFHEFGITLDF